MFKIFIFVFIIFLSASCGRQDVVTFKPVLDNRLAMEQVVSANKLAMEQISSSSDGLKYGNKEIADENKTYQYTCGEGENPLILLKSKWRVQAKNFSSLGEFVEGIDGRVPSNGDFWAFYVNDKLSEVGASEYKCSNNDLIKWKLEKIR